MSVGDELRLYLARARPLSACTASRSSAWPGPGCAPTWRAHLLYGDWLHRECRRTEAREQLPTAHGMLRAMGVEAFAERARGELQATGETARGRPAAAGIDELTAHEAQIARLDAVGLG
jgi:hypothetical protein